MITLLFPPRPPTSGLDYSRFTGDCLRLVVLFAVCLFPSVGSAQEPRRSDPDRLPRAQYKSGEETLNALADLSRARRNSVVKLEIDGKTVALGAVVDANGLVLTKASELHPGKLTAWLSTGKEVAAEILGSEVENDVALVKVEARNLKPVEWATGRVNVGQWVVTPGTAETPQALGIVSVAPRRIRHARALIGIHLARNGASTKIDSVMEGLGAQQAGLKPGDQILAVNQIPVNEGPELVRRLREFREGQKVDLKVQRDDHEFETTVSLMRAKGDEDDSTDRIDRMGGAPSDRSQGFELAIQHDTVLKPWMCGGPLLNLEGKAVGLNIARAGRVATYALTSDVARRISDQLKAKHTGQRRNKKS